MIYTPADKHDNGGVDRLLALISPQNRVQALQAIQRATTTDAISFDDYLVAANTLNKGYVWNWPYLEYVKRYLQMITDGKLSRLMLFLPPRHIKTTLVTLNYTAYRLEVNPSLRIILGAYNSTLVQRFSRAIRKRCLERGVPVAVDSRNVNHWETTEGGGLRAAGVGSGVTGNAGDLIIIDDPVKGREEADSISKRRRVWDWYTSEIFTRREPGSAIILIMTRWHEDDLAGRILRSPDGKNWKVISLPALAEEGDPLGRKLNEPLCPDRFNRKDLESIKQVLGRNFWALYQQRPQQQEGELFKRSWLESRIIKELPEGNRSFVRYWDKAGTKDGGSSTAGILLCWIDGRYYIVDVIKGKWAAPDREAQIRFTAHDDRDKWGHVVVRLEQEGGSGGKESAENTIRNLVGFEVYAERPTGDKTLRAEPVSDAMSMGQYYLLEAPWNEELIDVLTSFPYGTERDEVDALSGAHRWLSENNIDWEDILKTGYNPDFENRWV